MKNIFFDFDGTLTHKTKNIWRKIWSRLGYDLQEGSLYRKLYNDFVTNKITHQQWCDLSLTEYVSKGMNLQILDELTLDIKLIDGAEETFKALKEQGFSLHIVSGNITHVIKKVLGQNTKYFDSIVANEMLFDEKGNLIYIQGTKYDCEGKAEYIKEVCKNTNTQTQDAYFIGNGFNDEWVYLAGCNTICINSDDADQSNTTKWHKSLNISNLTEILYLIN